jgi:predicted ester cyclase
MPLERNKAIIRRLVEAFNKHDVALLDEFIAPDFVDAPNTPFELRGLKSYKEFEAMFIKGFPDFHETIKGIIAEGDKVWVLEKVAGTHKGEWNLFGITLAPTGKKITFTAVWMYRIVDGKVVEREGVCDFLDFFKQLGVIEYTEKGKKLFPEKTK